jgi:hypothetical protein
LEEKRTDLMAYLGSAGLAGEVSRVGIVDIGWRGTIQDNLAYAMPAVEWSGYYLALNRYLNAQPDNVRKDAFGPDLNLSGELGHLLDFVAPLEMLCNSPNGSVVGYERSEAGVKVHRHVDHAENQIHERYIKHFQLGVLDSIAYWAEYLRTHAYASEEIRPAAMGIWAGVIQRPPPFLAQAYFQLNHNETFGMGGFSDKRRMLTRMDVLKAFVSKSHRAKLHAFLMENGWLPGLMACPDVDPGFRKALAWFLWVLKMRSLVRRRVS